MSYSSEVLADSPLLYWRLGEGAGPTAADTSGNGRTGTYSGAGITYGVAGGVVGDNDTAITTVSASSGHIDSAVSLNLSAFSVITVEFLLKKAAYVNTDKLLAEFATSNWSVESGTFVIDPDASTTNFQIGMRSVSAAQRTNTFARPSTGTYHHYAIVFNMGADTQKVYVDGNLQTLTPAGTATSGVFGNFVLRVGSRAGTSLFPNMTLDDFAIYSGELSAGRITAHYNASQGIGNALFSPMFLQYMMKGGKLG